MYALKNHVNIKMECEWYVTPSFEGFGRGEGEKSALNQFIWDCGYSAGLGDGS